MSQRAPLAIISSVADNSPEFLPSFDWITEEEWLRTAGAPDRSSHVSRERPPAIVGEPSLREQLTSPQEESRGAVEETRKRSRIVTTTLVFGALGLILATMLYAFEVIDQRAPQEFKAQSRMIQPETADSVAASPATSDSLPATQQTATGQTTQMPNPMLNTQPNVHRTHHSARRAGDRARHEDRKADLDHHKSGGAKEGSKKDGKRFAQEQHSDGSSLTFFPFR